MSDKRDKPRYDEGPIAGCGKRIFWSKGSETISEWSYFIDSGGPMKVAHSGTCGLNECCGFIYCERCVKRAGYIW